MNAIMFKMKEIVHISLINVCCDLFSSIKYCLNAFLNALWSDKILIHNGKLFHRFPPEYIKLHLNKSNLGRGTISLFLIWMKVEF